MKCALSLSFIEIYNNIKKEILQQINKAGWRNGSAQPS